MMYCILFIFTLFISHAFCSVPPSSRLWEEALQCPYVYHSVNVVTGEYCENEVDLELCGPKPLTIRRFYSSNDPFLQGWYFNHPTIAPDDKPLGGELAALENYHFDDRGRLCGICSTQEGLLYHTLHVDMEETSSDTLRCTLDGGAGRFACYTYVKADPCLVPSRHLLSEVRTSEGKAITYSYCLHPYERRQMVARREEPQGRYLLMDYYDSPYRDAKAGKVFQQKAPAGADSTPCVIARFEYHDGWTEVFDALENKTVYCFGKHGKLTAIQNYANDDTLYRTERFFWNESAQLVSRALEDAQGVIYSCRTFAYDPMGNILEDSLYGDLTGTGVARIQLDKHGLPKDNGVERYRTLYRYSDDDKHLLVFQSEDNGLTVRYGYFPDTDMLVEKLTYDQGQLRIREYYVYDAYGHLIEKTVDDGASGNRDDLAGATERKFARFVPRLVAPAVGMPEEVVDGVVELASGKEVICRQTRLFYSEKGEPIRSEVFDGQGSLLAAESHTYDVCGRPILISDNDGNLKEISYDALGNEILVREGDRVTESAYDFMNRLIATIESHADGRMTAAHNRYDLNGNRIAAVDILGNETIYLYDAFGRIVKTLYPQVLDAEGSAIRPETATAYDIMNRSVASTDANGYVTHMRYNVRGSPTRVEYPDGSCEQFTYYLDGSLAKKILRNGAVIHYTRDFLSRVTKEDLLSSDGKLVASTELHYSPFRLIGQTNALGQYSPLFYEGDENLLAAEQGTATGSIKPENSMYEHQLSSLGTVYDYSFYDEEGKNVLQTTVADAQGSSTITTYDALGRPNKVEKRGPLGELLLSKILHYDAAGNKTKEVYSILDGNAVTSTYTCSWSYGPCNRLELAVEDVGGVYRTTRYAYGSDGSLANVIKADGISLDFTYNAQGLPESVTSTDGTVAYVYCYDPCGRIVRIDDKISGCASSRSYDVRGNLVSETLANGIAVVSGYDGEGRRTDLALPGDINVRYVYHGALLSAVERWSAEGQLLYAHRYVWDSSGGKIEQMDLVKGIGSVRQNYDADGRLTAIDAGCWSEKLQRSTDGRIIHIAVSDPSGGYAAKYAYDASGQLTREEGHAEHAYSYDSLYNRIALDGSPIAPDSSDGCDANGNVRCIYNGTDRFLCSYDAFNRLTEAILPGKRRLAYTYDAFHRRLSASLFEWDTAGDVWIHRSTLRFIWDGTCEIGEMDADGRVQAMRILGAGKGAEVGGTVAIEIGQQVYAPIHDHRGSICCLIDASNGHPVEWVRYSAFGEEVVFFVASCPTGNPWRFCGKRTDPETSLVHFGMRDYNPSTGRWVTADPLGNPESINRFTYSLNDPVNRIDPQGLFSFYDFCQWIYQCGKSAYDFSSFFLKNVKDNLSIGRKINPYIENAGEVVLGRSFLLLAGFYPAPSGTGVYGSGELSDKVRVTMINGILNTRLYFKKNLRSISELHGGANIHFVFDATQGWLWDLCKAAFIKCGFSTSQAAQLATTWKRLIAEMGGPAGGGTIIHYAHSIGGAHTHAALQLLSDKERKMIEVYTFGSPSMIHDSGLERVKNYFSVRDGVCLFDPLSFFCGLAGIHTHCVPVGSWLGIPFIDHHFASDTYMEVLRMLGLQYLQKCEGSAVRFAQNLK